MGSVSVTGFSNDEAERLAKSKPNLRRLLFSSSQAVEQLARRPFFAAVLAKSIPQDAEPNTEADLIKAWWWRAGHDAMPNTRYQRQRALIDLAEKGVRNLGKEILVRDLQPETHAQLDALESDEIVRLQREGAMVSFTHDIFLNGFSCGCSSS
jgi:hypothetical protein